MWEQMIRLGNLNLGEREYGKVGKQGPYYISLVYICSLRCLTAVLGRNKMGLAGSWGQRQSYH